ncbi:hypothetical protein GYMLUDRAFT_152721 [Collybiopsis luxurians FD-317 M1]|nr:hypothetical protein GYMLUDRAFT_152721 [Collybiopsis luxurians FD-317 M1]
MDSYDVVDKMEYPSEDQIDEYEAFMITGSRADAYAQVKWIMKLRAFIVHLAKNHPRVKIFGLCFGHQVISAALGGKSVFNGKWELGPTKVHLTDTGKKVFGTQRDELTLHEIHQDIVPFVPQAFHLLGSSPVTMNQGVVSFNGAKYCFTPELAPNSHSITTFPSSLTEIHILTVQSHPEFTKPIVVELVNSMLSEPGKISDAEKADLERRMKALERSEGDGLVIGRTLWKILGVGWEDQ